MLLGCFEPIGRAKKTALGLKSKISSNLHFGRVLKTRDTCCCQLFSIAVKVAIQTISRLLQHKLIYLKSSLRYATNGVKCYFGIIHFRCEKDAKSKCFAYLSVSVLW